MGTISFLFVGNSHLGTRGSRKEERVFGGYLEAIPNAVSFPRCKMVPAGSVKEGEYFMIISGVEGTI